jgi:phosphorylase kinase alpha/beta subunit
MSVIVHNSNLSSIIKDSYTTQDFQALISRLRRCGTFLFPALPNGLFPAANLQQEAEYTGYSYVWIRDNIYVAYAHAVNGQTDIALKTVRTLMRYFILHRWRMERIIAGELDFQEPMNRPNIRFNGKDLSEINQKWAHAENDALGYFLWLFCRLHAAQSVPLAPEEREILTLFALYLNTVRYWEDEDSGHWEESRKIEASSIGVVMAGLRELKALLQKETGDGFAYRGQPLTENLLDDLIDKGRENLENILPAESIQPDPRKNRRYDAALLFLIFPTGVVSGDMANRILGDVTQHLQGDIGIRRYLGDSFWAANYKSRVRPEERTIDFSDEMPARDQLAREGQEAQWCIFDPIISIIHGIRYKTSRNAEDLQLQIEYFNRSLGQLTSEDSRFGACKCPELYYLEDGQYIPNDTVPLLWTQANLWMAFKFMAECIALAHPK